MLNERKLTSGEKSKLKKLEDKVPMKPFKDQYGDEGESVYYATLTKMAKESVMDPYDRLKAINESLRGSEDDVDPTQAATDHFENRYGIVAKPKTLRELSKGLMAKKNPKRASMAKQLLDMLNKKPEADLRDDR